MIASHKFLWWWATPIWCIKCIFLLLLFVLFFYEMFILVCHCNGCAAFKYVLFFIDRLEICPRMYRQSFVLHLNESSCISRKKKINVFTHDYALADRIYGRMFCVMSLSLFLIQCSTIRSSIILDNRSKNHHFVRVILLFRKFFCSFFLFIRNGKIQLTIWI